MRRATITRKPNGEPTKGWVERFLPDNYRITEETDEAFTISGRDNAGWTLDGYVIPRLASGLIPCEEIKPLVLTAEQARTKLILLESAAATLHEAQRVLCDLAELEVELEWNQALEFDAEGEPLTDPQPGVDPDLRTLLNEVGQLAFRLVPSADGERVIHLGMHVDDLLDDLHDTIEQVMEQLHADAEAK